MSVIAVCSGKGSPGATFVAVNLASAVARAGGRAMLLDLDPAGGDVAAYLGLDPKKGLYPLLRMNGSTPDAAAIAREGEQRDGVLAVGGFPTEAATETREAIAPIMRALHSFDEHVIADLGRMSEQATMAAREADSVLIVVRPDLVSVLGAERAMRAFDDAGIPRDVVRVVVSSAERKRPADVAEIAAALKAEVAVSVPFARKAARQSLLQQVAVTKGPLVKAFGELASALTTGTPVARETASSDLVGVPA